MLELIASGDFCTLVQNGVTLGALTYQVQRNGTRRHPRSLQASANEARVEFGAGAIVDRVVESDGWIEIQRRWIVRQPGKWRLFFNFIPENSALSELVIPALMYADNRHGEGKFPRGGLNAGWSFREDRIAIPACARLHDEKNFCLLFAEPARAERDIVSVRVFKENAHPQFEICIPFAEAPRSYRELGILLGGQRRARQHVFNLKVSELPFEYARSFYLQIGARTGNVFSGFKDAARFALEKFPGDAAPAAPDWSRIASLKLHHLLYLVVDDPQKKITGIQMGKGNGWWLQHAHDNTAASFLSKSLEGAYLLARAGSELGNEKLVALGERIARFFLKGQLANGLHQDFFKFSERRMSSFHVPFDKTTAEMRGGANARCNGEAMLHYLRLYALLKKRDREIPEFLEVATRNLNFYIAHQLDGDAAGSFGRWWNAAGNVITAQGTNGAHIIPALIELEKIGGRKKEIDRALERAAAYYGALIDRGEYYGDTLDADCTDKEAGVILLRAFLDLYERDQNAQHLAHAQDAASYVLSWMWTYDVPFAPNTPLARENFKTRGMTAVSVAIQHLDVYGMCVAYDLLRLAHATGDDAWENFARAMIAPCAQLISTPENHLNRSRKYIGWQPEHIYQTDFDYFYAGLGGKGTYDTCIAWVTVLTLGAMDAIRERFPDALNFSYDASQLARLDPNLF